LAILLVLLELFTGDHFCRCGQLSSSKKGLFFCLLNGVICDFSDRLAIHKRKVWPEAGLAHARSSLRTQLIEAQSLAENPRKAQSLAALRVTQCGISKASHDSKGAFCEI